MGVGRWRKGREVREGVGMRGKRRDRQEGEERVKGKEGAEGRKRLGRAQLGYLSGAPSF